MSLLPPLTPPPTPPPALPLALHQRLRPVRHLPAEVRALGAFSFEEYEEVYLPWFRAEVARWRVAWRGRRPPVDETGLLRAAAFVGAAAEPDRFTENGLKVLLLTCQMPALLAPPAYCEAPDALAPYAARVEQLWGAVQRLAAGGEAALSDEDVGLLLCDYTRDLREHSYRRVYDQIVGRRLDVEAFLRRGEERLRRHPEVGALYDRLLDEKKRRAHQYLTRAAAIPPLGL